MIEKRENIENFNKKALYIMIREMTNSNTQHITRVVNVNENIITIYKKNYLTTGSIETKICSWDNLYITKGDISTALVIHLYLLSNPNITNSDMNPRTFFITNQVH